MGLGKREQANFVRIKEGKFYLGKDKEEAFDELTGRLTDLSFKDDTFDGKTIKKLVLNIQDGEDNYILSFPFDSSYSSTFVSFAKNADLSRPITLVPLLKTEGEKTSRSLLLSQDGKFMKAYYTKETPHGQPNFKKVTKKSGKVEWDKEDFLEFRENVILNELKPTLTGIAPTRPTATTIEPELIDSDDSDELNDDLPF